MYNSLFFFLMIFLVSIAYGQENTEEFSTNETGISNWQYDAFTYADFGTGEQHSYMSVIYELNPKLYLELQSYYDAYRSGDILDTSFRVRWYPVKKIYFFTGFGTQLQHAKVGKGLPVTPFRMVNGFGFEPNKNMSIETVHDLNFNTNSAGFNSTPNLFSIRGKYRF